MYILLVDFTQLQPRERLALAALVRAMVRLDRSFSAGESERLDRIAEELGDAEAFWRSIEEAEQQVTDGAKLEAVTREVTRPEARGLILDVLESLAVADAGSAAEEKMLSDLRALWGIASSSPYRG